jgi:hypothetical protein
VVCTAQVDSLTGHAARARVALEHALVEERPVWALAALAEAQVRAGDDASAEATYRAAPDDPGMLNALADLLLELHRPDEVEPLLSGRFSDDDALLRLAIAEKQKRGRSGPYAQMLRWRYQAAAGEAAALREHARFQLEVEGDAEKALALALREWNVRKEPADARVLLESALAAGKPEAAREAAAFVLDSGAEEPRLVALAKKVKP